MAAIAEAPSADLRLIGSDRRADHGSVFATVLDCLNPAPW